MRKRRPISARKTRFLGGSAPVPPPAPPPSWPPRATRFVSLSLLPGPPGTPLRAVPVIVPLFAPSVTAVARPAAAPSLAPSLLLQPSRRNSRSPHPCLRLTHPIRLPFSSNLTSSIPIGPPCVRSSISMPAPPPPRPQKSPRPRVPRSDRHLSRHDSWPTTTSIRYHSPDSDPPAFRRSDFSAFYVNLSLPSKIRAPVLIHENIPDLDSGPLPPYLVRSLHESGNPPMLSCAASWLSNLDTAPPIIPSPLPRDCRLLRTVQSPS